MCTAIVIYKWPSDKDIATTVYDNGASASYNLTCYLESLLQPVV